MTARKKDIIMLLKPFRDSHFLILLQADSYNRFDSTSLTNDELDEIKQELGVSDYDVKELIAQTIEVHMQESYIPVETIKNLVELYYIKGHLTEQEKNDYFQCCGVI